jgi:hypothetical protein
MALPTLRQSSSGSVTGFARAKELFSHRKIIAEFSQCRHKTPDGLKSSWSMTIARILIIQRGEPLYGIDDIRNEADRLR